MPRSKKPQTILWNVWAEDPDAGFVVVAEISVRPAFPGDRPTGEQVAPLRETYGFVICRPATAGFPADLMM